MIRLRQTLFLLTLTALAASTTLAADAVTFASLLKEMANREALARFPQPAYDCRQASSYDRESVDPAEGESWFANFDRSHFVRIEDAEGGKKEYVMMDVDGPGAIVRIWGTWHGAAGKPFSNGTLRVYLDGSGEPAIEGPIQEVLDGGKLCGPPLSQGVAPEIGYNQQGHNLYLPIPYANGCRVTYTTDAPIDPGARTGEALYYQINYRAYASGTQVESFSIDRLEDAQDELDSLLDRLNEGDRPSDPAWQTNEQSGTLAAGEESDPLVMEGVRGLRRLELKIDAEDLPQALRSTVMKIEFDGEQTVWAPVGDFFGIGYQMRPHQTWYTKVTEDGLMSCAWVMPFQNQAKLSLANVGDQPVEVKLARVTSSDWQWDDRSMLFHATWRELNRVATRRGSTAPGTGAFDVNYVTVQGKGVYAGDTLAVYNGAPAWWGEGDEKIYVDGESFPSHFGTGTEDYYGYAWCRPESFTAPFHSQPEGMGNLRGGFSVNNRYRALDAIPFTNSLRFDMEQWHWANTEMNFAPATFFYARPGAKANVKPDPKAAARPVNTSSPELPEAQKVEGAEEGEALEVVRKTGGVVVRQSHAQYGWSGDEQLWWRDAKPGDELVIAFNVDKAGEYEVLANLTKAADYGKVQVAVNDAEPSETFDRYHGSVSHDVLSLGTHELKEGKNRLTFVLKGHNEKAAPRGMVGIDYLMLKSADQAEDE